MRAFILAGGFATRLWPLTEKRAKPLLPLLGKPLIEHIVEGLPRDLPITLSTNAAFEEAFRTWKNGQRHPHLEVIAEKTKNDDEKLGALGALAQWITEGTIDDDILLLTGDNYFGFDLSSFIDAFTEDTALVAACDIADREKAKKFGTLVLAHPSPVPVGIHPVLGFEEKPSEPASTVISTGCSILPRSSLPILLPFAREHPDNVGGIFEELLRRGHPVAARTFDEPWFDIGSFQSFLEATRSLLGDAVLQGQGSSVEQSTLQGSVVVGDRSVVQDSHLRDVVLFEDCIIEDCVLRDCIIDRGCRLKGVDIRGKMIREATELISNH